MEPGAFSDYEKDYSGGIVRFPCSCSFICLYFHNNFIKTFGRKAAGYDEA